MHLSPPHLAAWAAARSKAVILLLFNILPIVCGSSVFVMHYLFKFILKTKRKLVALLLLSYKLQMYGYYRWFVALSYGVVAWSAVCDCGLS